MVNVTIRLLFLLAIGVGIILLQVILSKKESKWLGLILPAVSFLVSLVAVISIAAYTNTGDLSMQTMDEGGIVVQEEVTEASNAPKSIQNTSSLILTVVSVFLLYNIPTVVLLAIYFACRQKQRQRKALDKMQAQDLE